MPEPEIEITEPEITEPAPVVKCELCKAIAELREERSRLSSEFIDHVTKTFPSEVAEARKCSKALAEAKLKLSGVKQKIDRLKEQHGKVTDLIEWKKLQKELSQLQAQKGQAEVSVSIAQGKYNETRSRLRSIEKKALRHTDPGKKFDEATVLCSNAERNHPKCPGCSMLYGKFHEAKPTFKIKYARKTKGLGFCQYCQQDYKNLGKNKFLQRLADMEKYDHSEMRALGREIAKAL